MAECKSDLDKNKLVELIKPFEDSLLNYHTAKKLKGKDAVGNIEEAEKEFRYVELEI